MKAKITFLMVVLLGLLALPASAWANGEETPPQKAYIRGVRGQQQSYALSCESRSAVDWASYWGVEISEKKFLKRLPRSDNPEKGFVGNPSDQLGQIPPASYGVHAEPVASLLREFGLGAQAHKNADWSLLQAEIAKGRPVIVWVIGQMWKGVPVRYSSLDGEKSVVARYEHTMILVGYTPKKVNAIDPATGSEHVFALQDFLTSWKILGNMAITASKSNEENPSLGEQEESVLPTLENESVEPSFDEQVEEDTPATIINQDGREKKPRSFYIVKRGEYLIGIAKKIGVNWRDLARLNKLSSPYILYTGQKLRLP